MSRNVDKQTDKNRAIGQRTGGRGIVRENSGNSERDTEA